MIVSVLQENLLRALTRAGRTVSVRPQLPIVQNVLLQTREGRLQITTTNLENTETVWVGAKNEKDGGICVPARLLTEFVLTLPAETVSLRVEDGGLLVQCAGFRATIPGVSVKEFPSPPEASAGGGEKLDKEALVAALSMVLFAAATDEGRPVLTGVRIKTEKEETVFAATDGYRLSLRRVSRVGGSPLDLIVPARALFELVKTSQEEHEAKHVTLTRSRDGQLIFVVGDTELSTRLIDGEYPNIDKIIPTKFTTRALIDKEALFRAVKSAALFARDNANIVQLSVVNQSIVVSASSSQMGKNQVEVAAKVDGEGGEIAFNSRFVLELLSNFPESEILFEMTGALNPGVFRPIKDSSFLHIIMPVRTSSG
ncbi:DNA polymerase III subunit beta [Candidatus Gottesmanbacteria bacterium]|nr:DNA polymerase III subunit beta [Candidatus Gottesmanbacteria bacterium]